MDILEVHKKIKKVSSAFESKIMKSIYFPTVLPEIFCIIFYDDAELLEIQNKIDALDSSTHQRNRCLLNQPFCWDTQTSNQFTQTSNQFAQTSNQFAQSITSIYAKALQCFFDELSFNYNSKHKALG